MNACLDSIAQTVLHRFASSFETKALRLIWRHRCPTTIAWGQGCGIATKTSTSKYMGLRGAWSERCGYIICSGFCVRSVSLAMQEDERSKSQEWHIDKDCCVKRYSTKKKFGIKSNNVSGQLTWTDHPSRCRSIVASQWDLDLKARGFCSVVRNL